MSTESKPRITCGLCGHEMVARRCGFGSVVEWFGVVPLCHNDSHSCYTQWSRDGVRPSDNQTGTSS